MTSTPQTSIADTLSAAWQVQVSHKEGDTPGLEIRNLTIGKPDNSGTLIEDFSLSLNPGDRFILTGASGSGKSTIIRAILIRTLKNPGTGEIDIIGEPKILCLSQKASFPGATLLEILNKKLGPSRFSDEEMDKALTDAGLDKLRIMIPVNQAKADYLAGLCAPYIQTAFKTWGKRLSRLDKKQREQVFDHMESYMECYAENFFPDTLKPYLSYPEGLKPFMKSQLRLDLSKAIRNNFESAFDKTYKTLWTAPNLMNFGNRLERFAEKLAKYFLQASALELEKSMKDGRQLSRELSGGEQQKVGFAQVFLHKPDILFLDESTASMDDTSTHTLYEAVVKRFPDSIILSIAHNLDVIKHHTLHGHLEDRKISIEPVQP